MSAPVHLPVFNSLQLSLPAWFAVPTKNYGNPKQPIWWSLANPTTTARNLSNRQHSLSIDLVRKSVSKPKIEKNPWDNFERGQFPWAHLEWKDGFDDDTMIPEHFDELDQKRIERLREHPGKSFANYPVIERGRPDTLEANIIYNRHHKHHTLEQKYGNSYLDKVKETIIGKPIDDDDVDENPDRSPSSSRTHTARSSASSISSKSSKSSRPSRLSSLASSISLSKKSSKDSSSEEDSDSGSEEEYDSITSSQERSFARRQGDKNVFRPNASVSSKSSKSSRSSVSRGKPPLKRPEPKPKRLIVSRQPKPKPKTPSVSSASSASSKGSSESSSSSGSSRRSEPPAPPPPVVVVPETGKTKWAKPVGAQATAPRVQKARGRKPKYATDEEAYQAKLEQNRLGKQRKAEAKRKAKEDAEATTGTGITDPATPPKPETQEERRFKFEEEQRKKYTEALSAKTEKLRVKEEKRLAKVLADSSKALTDISKVKKPRKPRAKKPKKEDSEK
jgi:hypothetical protein